MKRVAPFDIPAKILTGLANGTLVRHGGVIQDTSGRVVMWLREMNTVASAAGANPLLPFLNPVTGSLNLAMQGVNAGISIRGFAAVTQQLNQVQEMVNITTAASILTLGVSAIGFTVITNKLAEMEGRLTNIQQTLDKASKKIDLSFYANFRAALDLANNAFSMNNVANRRDCALQATNRFIEAEHIYADLITDALENHNRICSEYLLTLCLAYIAEVRCYLELEEFDTATRRLQEGQIKINEQMAKYIDLLLTSRPVMYLHPQTGKDISLSRLTRIYQWKEVGLTENDVFELIRPGMVPQSDMFWTSHIDKWIQTLSPIFTEGENLKKGFWGLKDDVRQRIINKLPTILVEMEAMVETSQRLLAYEIEIKAMKALGISFHEWTQLQPFESPPENSSVMCILPKEQLVLEEAYSLGQPV